MKFLSVLALTGLAAAEASIYERQVQALVGVVNQVNQATGDLSTAVKSFSGASDVQKLQSASQKVGSAVSSGVQTVNGASTISLTDAVQIQGQVQNLQQSVEGVVSDLISKKQQIYSAGAGQQVESNLQDQLKGAQALSAAIASKVPPEVQGLAQTLSAGIASALQKGVDAFKDAPAGSPSSGSSAPLSNVASSGSSASVKPASASKTALANPVATSSRPKPATYTGAASPLNAAGSFAGVAALFAFAL